MRESPKPFDIAIRNPRAGIHATLTTANKNEGGGVVHLPTTQKQGYCNTCQMKTKYNFSQFLDNIFKEKQRKIWMFHADNGRSFFDLHT